MASGVLETGESRLNSLVLTRPNVTSVVRGKPGAGVRPITVDEPTRERELLPCEAPSEPPWRNWVGNGWIKVSGLESGEGVKARERRQRLNSNFTNVGT